MPTATAKPDDHLKLDEFLCFAVYAANHAFNRVYKPLLRRLGLTYPQYLVMVALWERDDQTVGGLGKKMCLESSTLTPLLKRLQTMKHIKRTRDPADERQVRVLLTDKGRRLREQALDIPGCIFEASGLAGHDLQRLYGEITTLRHTLEGYASNAARAA
jgi:MarR family transcriptional regulator, organic hydroperoxide resistance regulator